MTYNRKDDVLGLVQHVLGHICVKLVIVAVNRFLKSVEHVLDALNRRGSKGATVDRA
jgi:hypothetical protein